MSLFDKFLEKDSYKKLFDQLPEDQKPIILESMRKLVEEIEKNLIQPIENLQKIKTKK